MAKLQGMAKRDARSTRIAATIFLFPAVALLIIYMIYPIIDTFLISRLKWNGFYTAEKVFVGWDNWNTLIHDELFWNSFLHNVILMVCSILIQIPLGVIAYALGAKLFHLESFDYALALLKKRRETSAES